MTMFARLLHRATVAIQHWFTDRLPSPPGYVYDRNFSRVGCTSPSAQRSPLAPPHSAVSVSSASGNLQRHHGTFTNQPTSQPFSPPSYLRPCNTDKAALTSSSSSHQHAPIIRGKSETTHKAPLAPHNRQLTTKSDDGQNAKRATAGSDLREQAHSRKRMMKKAEKLTKAARKKRDRQAEAKHSRDPRGPKTVTKHLNSKASKIIFKERNRRRNLGRIDFHGLPVREALKCASQELQSTIQKPDKVMHFIVGKGSHSVDGRPKIRPAVKRLCEKQGFQAFQDPKNSGVLIVQRAKSPDLVQGHRTF